MRLAAVSLLAFTFMFLAISRVQADDGDTNDKILKTLQSLLKEINDLKSQNQKLKSRVQELETFVGDTKEKSDESCPNLTDAPFIPPAPIEVDSGAHELPVYDVDPEPAVDITPYYNTMGLVDISTLDMNNPQSPLNKRIESIVEQFSWKSKNFTIIPFGQLRGEAIYSTAPQTADAVIFHLNPRDPRFSEDQFTVHGKTSMLNFLIKGPKIGSFETGGLILMNFLGPQPLRNTSGVNVLNAYGELKNDRWRFAFGRMNDLFSPIAPTTVNMGQQRGAGNLGIFRGALHVDRYVDLHHLGKMTLSGRISQQAVNDFLVVPQVRGTDNGIPNFEARVGWEFGPEIDDQKVFAIGVSGLWGETRAIDPLGVILDGIGVLPPGQAVSTSWGVNLDWQMRCRYFGARGELWTGEGAGTYFMASLQSLNPIDGAAIQSSGGWGEVYVKPCCNLQLGLGYGIDNPRDSDVGFFSFTGAGQRTLNQVIWGNVFWDVTDFMQVGIEVSHRETGYLDSTFNNSGMLYHFSTTLKY